MGHLYIFRITNYTGPNLSQQCWNDLETGAPIGLNKSRDISAFCFKYQSELRVRSPKPFLGVARIILSCCQQFKLCDSLLKQFKLCDSLVRGSQGNT